MQKLSDIRKLIKLLEESILNDIDCSEYLNSILLPTKGNLEDLIQIRKTLMWVTFSQQRKKKDSKSKKLEDFDIENPVKHV